jgi:hypothetical protein
VSAFLSKIEHDFNSFQRKSSLTTTQHTTENSIAALNQKLPSLSSLPGRPKANESDVEKELSAWRDDLKLLTLRVAKQRAASRDAVASPLALPSALRVIAELERAACGGLDAPSQSALLALAPLLAELIDDSCSTDDAAQLFALSCDDLIHAGHKELRALRRDADKARERLVAAIHKSNAFQTKVKLPADLHKLLELETDRARCDRDLAAAERAVRRASRRMVVVRDAELLDSLVSFASASATRTAEAYAHTASADILVADARDNAVSARRRATVLRQRHASAAARADERRDIVAVDRLLDAFDAAAVAAMADAALGLRRSRPAANKRVASAAPPTPPPKPAGQSSNAALPPKPAGQSSNSALPPLPPKPVGSGESAAAADVPVHYADAQGAPFHEPLVALHRLRRSPHPVTAYAQMVQACVALRNAAAPFVLPAVLRLCGVSGDEPGGASLSSSSSSLLTSPTPVASSGSAVSPRGDVSGGSSSIVGGGGAAGEGATSTAAGESAAANSEVMAARLLLEAFVRIDVDLAFHGHESPPGRGLPGKWAGRAPSDLPSVLERSLKN